MEGGEGRGETGQVRRRIGVGGWQAGTGEAGERKQSQAASKWIWRKKRRWGRREGDRPVCLQDNRDG